jgi:hypothetical protein
VELGSWPEAGEEVKHYGCGVVVGMRDGMRGGETAIESKAVLCQKSMPAIVITNYHIEKKYPWNWPQNIVEWT